MFDEIVEEENEDSDKEGLVREPSTDFIWKDTLKAAETASLADSS